MSAVPEVVDLVSSQSDDDEEKVPPPPRAPVNSDNEDEVEVLLEIKPSNHHLKRPPEESSTKSQAERVVRPKLNSDDDAKKKQIPNSQSGKLPPPPQNPSHRRRPLHLKLRFDEFDNGTITHDILQDALTHQKKTQSQTTALTCIDRQRERVSTSDSASSSSTILLQMVPFTLHHIHQQDKWSCGFRNLQMLLTATIPHLAPNHAYFQKSPTTGSNSAVIPTVRQLQGTIEKAWKDGFDANGARHYGGKLVNKRQWVGAVEIASIWNYLGMDCTIVQFIKCADSRRQLPTFVKEYFSRSSEGDHTCPFCSGDITQSTGTLARSILSKVSSSVATGLVGSNTSRLPESRLKCDCPLLPLYCQWHGHSVTIVGYEQVGSQEYILVYDPLKMGLDLKIELQRKQNFEPLRRPLKFLVQKDVQLIIPSLREITTGEYMRLKYSPDAETAARAAVERHVQMYG